MPVQTILLAGRNLSRQRRRTAAAMSSIAFGAIALLLAGGFIEWLLWGMREGVIQGQLGHIQVMQAEYLERGQAQPFDFVLPPDPERESLLSEHPHVQVVTPRLAFAGLVSRDDHTVPFLGEGVDPEREEEVSADYRITGGAGLRDGPKVILGVGLAATLDANPGDQVALLVSTASGGFNAVEVTVSGLFTTANKALNDIALRIPINTARELLRVEGQHTWVVLLEDTRHTDAVRASLVAQMGAEGLDIVPWHVQADFFNKTAQLFSRQISVLQAMIVIIILLGISNTLMMNVLERTGEIGTQLALGFRRKTIIRQFFTEGLLVGILGGGLGIVLGIGAAWALSTIGIPMPPPPGMDTGFVAAIRVTPSLIVVTFALVAGATALAGLYPAWRASRLNIVDALRHNR